MKKNYKHTIAYLGQSRKKTPDADWIKNPFAISKALNKEMLSTDGETVIGPRMYGAVGDMVSLYGDMVLILINRNYPFGELFHPYDGRTKDAWDYYYNSSMEFLFLVKKTALSDMDDYDIKYILSRIESLVKTGELKKKDALYLDLDEFMKGNLIETR
jgi:hypothetical protein